MKKELNKILKDMKQAEINLTVKLKTYKRDCGESAFIFGELKQLKYWINCLEEILIIK